MKIAIVTGASSGMGKEFVRQIERFYRELDEIWVIARSEKKLEEIRALLDPPVGKSGVNHRLRKISEYAEQLRLERGD